MLLDAQVEVTARVAYVIRITRITLKFIHNALLVYKWELSNLQRFSFLWKLVESHDRFSFQGRLVACERSRQISDLWKARFLYRAVNWLNTALILILGGVKSLRNGINTLNTQNQYSEHSKWLHSSETVYLNFSHFFICSRLVYSNVFSHLLFSL